ncbi:MAG: UvrD/REP helicase N-terminal domain, partial [Deltaproteobacteria bacterium]|nr:UvrD/REP helicase N-terminal domain [Deltaproteobacteria bacterium]
MWENREKAASEWPLSQIRLHSSAAASAPAALCPACRTRDTVSAVEGTPGGVFRPGVGRSLRRTSQYASVPRLAGAAHRRSRCDAVFVKGATKPVRENRETAANEFRRDLAVDASAGTGKTSTLVARATNLFLASPDLSPDHVLLLTFTDKAAAEMKARVTEGWERLFAATQ